LLDVEVGPRQRFVEGFKAFSSFDAELGLDQRSEDGLAVGIKLGIRSTLGVKLCICNSPEAGFDDGSSLGFELGIDAVSEDGFDDGSSLDFELSLDEGS
jgi:hypothetical protein